MRVGLVVYCGFSSWYCCGLFVLHSEEVKVNERGLAYCRHCVHS